MSIHANQAVKGGPSSSRDEIQGAGATYRASIQKQARIVKDQTSKAKDSGQRKMPAQSEGSAPINNVGANAANNGSNYGDGHYQPNKG